MNSCKYTRETFFKIYSDANESDFLDYEEAYAEKLEKALHYYRNSNEKKLNLVAIDEEYYHYLNKLNVEDTEENMLDYINHLTDEDIQRLWYKNGMNTYLGFYSLQLIFAQPHTIINEYNYPLHSEIIEELSLILSSELKINKVDILIGNEACIPSYLFEHQDIYIKEMTAHFMNWQKYNYRAGLFTPINRQEETGTVQIMVRNIPVCIKQLLPCTIQINNNKFTNPFRSKTDVVLMVDRFNTFVELLKDSLDFKAIYVANSLISFRKVVSSERDFYKIIYNQAKDAHKAVSIN